VYFVSFIEKESTQIGEHIPAIVGIPGAGTLEGIKLGGREGGRGDRQGDRLVKSLLAGKADPSLLSLICMFITITAPAFHTGPQ
jgi:hypothetical protein